MKYIKPKSVTWWAGALSIVTGGAQIVFPESNALGQIGSLFALVTGGTESASPALLIFTGMGLIGLRAAPGVSGDA